MRIINGQTAAVLVAATLSGCAYIVNDPVGHFVSVDGMIIAPDEPDERTSLSSHEVKLRRCVQEWYQKTTVTPAFRSLTALAAAASKGLPGGIGTLVV